MRLFGGERMQNMMEALNLEDDMPIENKMLTGTIESAQQKVEARNFGIRKNVLQFDDVMNRQREIIYEPALPRCWMGKISTTTFRR